MTVGIRNDHEGNPEYPCSKYGYVIKDDGSSIKCECASWAGDGTNFGDAVDLSGELINFFNPLFDSIRSRFNPCAVGRDS